MYKNFDEWDVYEGLDAGSGRSEKQWLINRKGDNQIGLFKFPKSEYTTEHFSEKIAADIASIINFPCAKIDLGTYNGREGVMSYRINSDREPLIEGVSLIIKLYNQYDVNKLFDCKSNEYYSLDMIMKSLQEFKLEKEFLKIPIFDFLIGNSDRHQNNWAIIKSDTGVKISPLYDNGSSLCCYENEENLQGCIKDTLKFKSIVDTKSKSMIRIDKYKKKKPTHLQVIQYIRNEYYRDTIDFVVDINRLFTYNKLDDLMNTYDGYISNNRIKLIKNFLKYKLKELTQVYNL
ncbi:protein kinase [Clostridium fermenticellae]|uniref:Protein kinase n=1 Tax=Clostridium fermenticellae TaxID=2068654 RepID=A0A386H0T6_9CLOT|nr:HipA domain-containing protein [Clostridium fermenticellae]AYD39289.1 protein kinase [Clostridium fermenticellae]